jgi:ligand-binding SRPBCC domain-containing protein
MKLKIETLVKSNLGIVKAGFNESLFLKLSPPFPTVKLIKFDGCNKGDKVTIELNFILFKQIWDSEIIDESSTNDTWFFVDKGVKLPFFLKNWHHTHSIKTSNEGAKIIDDVTFTTGTLLTDILTYPFLWMQFLYRKPIYKRAFNTK